MATYLLTGVAGFIAARVAAFLLWLAWATSTTPMRCDSSSGGWHGSQHPAKASLRQNVSGGRMVMSNANDGLSKLRNS